MKMPRVIRNLSPRDVEAGNTFSFDDRSPLIAS